MSFREQPECGRPPHSGGDRRDRGHPDRQPAAGHVSVVYHAPLVPVAYVQDAHGGVCASGYAVRARAQ